MNVEIVVLNCHKCNQCLKGHKSLGSLFEGALLMYLSLSLYLSLYLCLKLSFFGQVMSPHHPDQM